MKRTRWIQIAVGVAMGSALELAAGCDGEVESNAGAGDTGGVLERYPADRFAELDFSGRLAAPAFIDAQAYETEEPADLGTAARAADAVVVGVVVEVRPGRIVGEAEADAIQLRELELEVEQPLAGRLEEVAPGRVLVEEVGWVASGHRLRINRAPELVEDERALWFLRRKADVTELPAYRALGSAAFFPLAPDGRLARSERSGGLAGSLEGRPLDDVARALSADVAR